MISRILSSSPKAFLEPALQPGSEVKGHNMEIV